MRSPLARVLGIPALAALASLVASCGSDAAPAPNPTADAGSDATGDVASQETGETGTGDPCSGVTARTVTLAATASEADVQKAFVSAAPGDVIVLAEATYAFTNTLSIAANCVTVRGAGIDKTILDFSTQAAGSEGIYGDKVKGFTMEGFTVRETKGNAIKVLGGDYVTFRRVKTLWTGADATKHGAYGMYPVSSKHVLVEDSVAIGASDAGIYVGQSQFVVVRRNSAEKNVAGIEIENTFDADVYDNTATDNTGGILVFDLPGVPQLGGHATRVFKNKIIANNRPNFAPEGNIVGVVPAGTGFLVMANTDVEAFDNRFENNDSFNAAVASYLVTQIPIKDAAYYPYPRKISIHDNTFVGGGTTPDSTKELGVLMAVNKDKFTGGVVADILYDGIFDAKETGGTPENPMRLCVRGNTDATFANLRLDKLPSGSLDASLNWSLDPAPFDCALPPLPTVGWTGLAP